MSFIPEVSTRSEASGANNDSTPSLITDVTVSKARPPLLLANRTLLVPGDIVVTEDKIKLCQALPSFKRIVALKRVPDWNILVHEEPISIRTHIQLTLHVLLHYFSKNISVQIDDLLDLVCNINIYIYI
jgi:hypothetical protein